MRIRFPRLGLSRLAGLACLAAAATAMPAFAREDECGDKVPHQFVVRLNPSKELAKFLDSFEATLIAAYPEQNLYLVESTKGADDDETELELEGDDDVESVCRNELNGAVEGGTQTFFVSIAPAAYPNQPASRLLKLPATRNISTGQGVVVALLDTGISSHWAIDSQVLAGGYNFVDGNADVSDVGNLLDDNGDGAVDEMVGHGTFVSGLVSLVAPGCRLLPVKVLNSDGFGNSFTVAAGIYYAADHGASIINLSLYTPNESIVVAEAIAYANALGCTVVAAAGNESVQIPRYPAATKGVIAVAGTDSTDALASFSNVGSYVAVSAPSVTLISTLPGNRFASCSGTSFSSALTSGTAAIVKARFPKSVPASIRSLLANTSVSLAGRNPTMYMLMGRGRIDPLAALQGHVTTRVR